MATSTEPTAPVANNGLLALLISKGVDSRSAPTVGLSLEVDGIGLLTADLTTDQLAHLLSGTMLRCHVEVSDVT